MAATLLDSYMPYDSGPGANVTEAGWRNFAKYFRGDGVIRTAANGFNTFADSTGLQVKVDTGECWIAGAWGQSTSLKTKSITSNSSGNPRIDMVILRNDFVANTISVDVLTGTAGISPSPPTVTQNTSKWETQLALVSVASGAVTINAADVTFAPQLADTFLWAQNRITNSGLISGSTPIGVVSTPAVCLAANWAYRITFDCRAGTNVNTVAADEFNATIFTGATFGTTISAKAFEPIVGSQHGGTTVVGLYTTTAVQNSVVFTGGLSVIAGARTIQAVQPGTSLVVEQMGPSSLVTTV